MKTSARPDQKDDPRLLPSYGISEATHYLWIPRATLRSWVLGREYPTSAGIQSFKPIIDLPEKSSGILSFVNLVEAHMLGAIRKDYELPLHKIRRAIEYLKKEFDSEHPLAEYPFQTDGINLFVEKYSQLINISQNGQLAMKEILKAYLRRVEHDAAGFPLRLYPFTRKRIYDEPRSIVIDPFVAFGRPVLAGTNIPTVVIAERYKAGETIEELAIDYGRPELEIQEAIRCEFPNRAAA